MNFNPGASINQANLTQIQVMGQANQLAHLKKSFASPEDQQHKELKKAAQEFESVFIKQLLDAMDKTVDREGSILSGGSAEEYFRGMLNEHIAQSFADRPGGSGFGLAENVYRQMANEMKADTRSVKPRITMGQDSGNAATNKVDSVNEGQQ